jgi:biotin synthase
VSAASGPAGGVTSDAGGGASAASGPLSRSHTIDREVLLSWLKETDSLRLEELWQAADETRRRSVGDAVHLRGLIEVSNHCVRQCWYCGLRAGNRALPRYRMSREEVLACAEKALAYGYGTVVLQSGEDYGLTREWVAETVREIKAHTGSAVTLSLGERPDADLVAWREAGADRYLLRFETSDPALYAAIHPPGPRQKGRAAHPSDRIEMLLRLRELGYEIGSGIMVGIPGQTYASVVADLLLFGELDLDMIGVGPYLPHPATPLGKLCSVPAGAEGGRDDSAPNAVAQLSAGVEQIPSDELTVYKVLALARLVCPQANLPSTTALATLNKESGRELGLRRGANIVMPNLTPPQYRVLYEIYPDKVCVSETAEMCHTCLRGRIEAIGRTVGTGPGGRRRCSAAA